MSKKVAIVTGSNKGIGFSIVKRLCSGINTFRDFLKQNYDGIDVLVNNAGVYIPVISIILLD